MSVGVIYNTKFYEGIMFSDLDLMPIWDKVRDGKRLSFDDGLTMYRTEDFPALGKMADWVKTKLHGNKVYFVLNRHVNPTNICVLSCGFCDYAKKREMPIPMKCQLIKSWACWTMILKRLT